jgi:hypothetical protein
VVSTTYAEMVDGHRRYVASAEFEGRKERWRQTAGNKAPFVLSLGQAWLAAVIVGIYPAILVAPMAAWWIVAWVRSRKDLRTLLRPMAPVCRAHGFPRRRPRCDYHHLAYRALNGRDMTLPSERATAAGLERNLDAMAVCRVDHRCIERTLKIAARLLHKRRSTLRRLVSWGWVIVVRATVAAAPMLVLREVLR